MKLIRNLASDSVQSCHLCPLQISFFELRLFGLFLAIFLYYSAYTFVSAAKGDETNHFDLIYHLLGGTGEDTELPDMTVLLEL